MDNYKNYLPLLYGLTSPEIILKYSGGEVTSADEYNAETGKPEKLGLYSEEIFGTGKNKDVSSDRFTILDYDNIADGSKDFSEIDSGPKKIGHIRLAVPVVNKQYEKEVAIVLGMTDRALQQVLNYERLVVVDAPKQVVEFKSGDVVTEDIVYEKKYSAIHFEWGAEAIDILLRKIKVPEVIEELQEIGDNSNNTNQQRIQALTRLKTIKEIITKCGDFKVWINAVVMRILPVMPPNQRMVAIVNTEGRPFITIELTDINRRIINRNNRLKGLIEIKAPEVITRNEKRMLSDVTNLAFDLSRESYVHYNSIINEFFDTIGLYTKRADKENKGYVKLSADDLGVPIAGTDKKIQIHEIGVPLPVAKKIYKNQLLKNLLDKKIVKDEKAAIAFINKGGAKLLAIVKNLFTTHPLCYFDYSYDDYAESYSPGTRPPFFTIFLPKLVTGKKILFNPLISYVSSFFRDDQSALEYSGLIPEGLDMSLAGKNFKDHVERTKKERYCFFYNIKKFDFVYDKKKLEKIDKLSKADRKNDEVDYITPLSETFLAQQQIDLIFKYVLLNHPHQNRYEAFTGSDLLFIFYYITKDADESNIKKLGKETKSFGSLEEARAAINFDYSNVEENGPIQIVVKPKKGPATITTTLGRILFNSFLPSGIAFVNQTLTPQVIGEVIITIWQKHGLQKTTEFVCELIKQAGRLHRKWVFYYK